MSKVTPLVNGVPVQVTGSFVVGPGLHCALDLDGTRLQIEFANDDTSEMRAETKVIDGEPVVKLINPSTIGSALDLEGFFIEGSAVIIHLAIITIGLEDPHRVINYTITADS